MDRCAVFVDAGYLLSAGGWLCCNQPRAGTACDYDGVTKALREWCVDDARVPLLRLYWYDGAPNMVPTADHERIAALTEVKVRLGRRTSAGQKGVDSRIVRDLISLSRERTMVTAYLLSGDDDLREGVTEAQDVGVRVVLLGLPPTRRSRQSYSLIAESDQHVVLAKDFWAPYFSPAAQTRLPLPFTDEQPEEDRSTTTNATPTAPQDSEIVDSAASAFAATVVPASSDRREELLRVRPSIPRHIDVGLLKAVSSALGREIRDEEALRRRARVAFWAAIVSDPDPGEG